MPTNFLEARRSVHPPSWLKERLLASCYLQPSNMGQAPDCVDNLRRTNAFALSVGKNAIVSETSRLRGVTGIERHKADDLPDELSQKHASPHRIKIVAGLGIELVPLRCLPLPTYVPQEGRVCGTQHAREFASIR